MLFTMVFQTLYFLADLYWMGRLGKEAVAGGGRGRQHDVRRAGLTQMLGVGTTTLVAHAAGRKDRDGARRIFNQAQGLSMLAGVLFLVVGLALTPAYADRVRRRRGDGGAGPPVPVVVRPGDGAAVPMVALAAALRGIGDFKPGMIVQSRTVVLNIVLAPVLIFGWGTGLPLGVAGAAAASFVAVVVGVVWLSRYVERPGSFLHFRRDEMAPDARHVEAAARHRPARRRRVRPDRRLHGRGLRREPAVRRRGAGRVRHRPAGGAGRLHADRRARLRGGAGGRPELRRPSRPTACARRSASPRRWPWPGCWCWSALCHLAPAAMIRRVQRPTRRWWPSARSTCASCRGTSWPAGWCSWRRACSRRWGTPCRRSITSAVRVVVVAIPAFVLARRPDFRLVWVWYLTVVSVTLQMAVSLWLLNREFRRRLVFEPVPAAPAGGRLAPGSPDNGRARR